MAVAATIIRSGSITESRVKNICEFGENEEIISFARKRDAAVVLSPSSR